MTALALVEDFNPDVSAVPLQQQQTAIQLVLDLEAAGMLTATAMTLTDPDLPYERAEALAVFLGSTSRRWAWYIGDLLVFSENVYGEQYAQLASAIGLSEQTLLGRIFVAKNVPPERRKANLSFSCHALVARKSPQEQEHWLGKASEHGWGYAQLKDAMKAARKEERPPIFDDDDDPDINAELVLEVAAAILRDARASEDPTVFLVPAEDIARLRAALGEDEDVALEQGVAEPVPEAEEAVA